jgi:hypothetical protein
MTRLACARGVGFAYLYNRLYSYSNAAEANLGQIRVAMKERLDMIEQFLGAVKGYTEYERGFYLLSFGLNTSSREYPISVKLTATKPMKSPGGTIHHQAPLEKPPQV